MFIVPTDLPAHRAAHGLTSRGNGGPSKPFLECPNGPFDHGNTTMLTNGPEPGSNVAPLAPAAISLARPEWAAIVADQMTRRLAGDVNGSAQEDTDVIRIRRAPKERESHDAARIMIEDQCDRPTKGPALRQREGNPGTPPSR
jgi:hypothetical protein